MVGDEQLALHPPAEEEEVRTGVPFQVTMDCADLARLAAFWALALDYAEPPPPDGYPTWQEWVVDQGWPDEDWNSANALEDPAGIGPRIYSQCVPDLKIVKNRVHLDLNVSGGKQASVEERRRRVDAKADQLVQQGAQVLRVYDQPEREPDCYGVVMQDPEGNEFCLQ